MKRSIMSMVFLCSLMVASTGCGQWADNYAKNHESMLRDPLSGWNIMTAAYLAPNALDGLTFEWDYYSVHDNAGKYTGTIGYCVVDPRGHLSGEQWYEPYLMPSGINVVIAGKFADGTKFYSFDPHGRAGMELSATERSLYTAFPDGRFGQLIPVRGTGGQPDKMVLKGKTPEAEWEITVQALWPERNTLRERSWEVGSDVGLLAGEHWTVNQYWISTTVTGWIKRLDTGETLDIDGHGYRENAFGRWAFPEGGWDFLFGQDLSNQSDFAFQTYHYKSKKLDFFDVDFLDNGNLVSLRLYANKGEFGWYHNDFQYDNVARTYIPVDTVIIGKKAGYTIEINAAINSDYKPILADTTIVTNIYVINALFPQIQGTISRTATGEVVSTISCQGGGEFSVLRNFGADAPEGQLQKFKDNFRSPLP
jgi:hypothetical protein